MIELMLPILACLALVILFGGGTVIALTIYTELRMWVRLWAVRHEERQAAADRLTGIYRERRHVTRIYDREAA